MADDVAEDAPCDFVVVGSGAGGGPLAARLAEAGFEVVLLEAGGDPLDARPELYGVPAFHPFASEDPELRWDYFVRHAGAGGPDPKATPDGVLYPRAATLGGCTAHNAMIFVLPPDADWDALAEHIGDPSWGGAAMRRHAQAVEQCHHRPEWRLPDMVGLNPTGHGWDGWLRTERAMPHAALRDDALLRTVVESAWTALAGDGALDALWRLLRSHADANDARGGAGADEGVWYAPLSTDHGRRTGARERVRAVADARPDRLRLELRALATRVVLDGVRAVAVEYRRDGRFGASPVPGGPGERRVVAARREVIVAGGAFNTPHLLMLSGIGAAEPLRALGIAPRIDLPGVGRNLQDRYEISVVNRMAQDWAALRGARFATDDPLYAEWAAHGTGMYASDGAVLAISRRSSPALALPDLFCMALLADFHGYFPGYSRLVAERRDCLSWTILKARTENRAGTVTLRSADPTVPPAVHFHSFEAGGEADVAAVVEGIRLARRLAGGLREAGLMLAEERPGEALQSDADLATYVRDNSWGHHASCSCAIGARADGGVLDSALRVHGAQGLRVVDASVFPRIPGFFIASAVYMVAEKAAEMILRSHTQHGDARHGL